MNDTISVPINLVSLAAAVEVRAAALTTKSSPDDILAVVGLLETCEAALDRLAMASDEPVEA
jgi:hypothetical protein